MKQSMSNRRMGIFIAAMVFLFTLTTVVQAEARQASLKTLLGQKGISMKLQRLDRTDGFAFGLSIKGSNKQSIVIAPGLDRMLLVVAGGQEVILQGDGTGKMQIIQATGDITYVLCIVTAITNFIGDLTTCTTGDPVCLVMSIVTVITDVINCSAAVAPAA